MFFCTFLMSYLRFRSPPLGGLLNELTTHNGYSVDGDERETPIIIPTNSHRFVRHVVVLAILATFTAASYAAGNLASSSAPADVQDAQASTPAPPPAVVPAPAAAAAPA